MSDQSGSTNNDEMLWKASVEDKTGEFFDKFDKRVNQTDANTSAKLGGMGGNMGKVAIIAGAVGGAFSAIGTTLLKAVTGGVQSIEQLITQSIKLRSEVDALNLSIEVTGRNAGYSTEQIQKETDALKAKGLTTSDSLSVLKKMIDGNMDLSKSTELVTLAQDASVISGKTSAETMQTLLQVIQAQTEASSTQSNRQSAAQLKSLGIYVDFQAAYQKAALAQGKTVAQLSVAERRQIALNSAVAAGKQIAGSYDEAQTHLSTTIKQLPAYYEEIKYALGGAFDTIYTAAIDDWEDFLKNLIKWLQDNKEELAAFAQEIAKFVSGSGKLLLNLLLDLIEVLPKLITLVPDLANSIANLLAPAFGTTRVEIEKAGSALQTFLKIVIIVSASMKTVKKMIVDAENAASGSDILAFFKELSGLLSDASSGNISETSLGLIKEFGDEFSRLSTEYDMFGKTEEEVAAKTDKFTQAQIAQQIASQKLADALTSADYQLNELKTTLDEAETERQIQAQRDAIVLAINTAHQQEDIERNYADNIRSIYESANDSRTEAARSYAESRIQIQKDLQRTLRDLLDNFNFEAGELARKRDAVGLLALIRSNKKQVEDAKRSAKDSQQQARENFQKTLATMDENLQKQLKKAEEARVKEYEALNRSLARQAEMKALYDKWEEEDRQRKLAKTLKEMWQNFQAMDGMTQDGLNQLLNDWGTYYTTLASLISTWNTNLNGAVTSTGLNPASSNAATSDLLDQHSDDLSGTTTPTDTTGMGGATTTNIGQSGQVSSLLINSLDTTNLQRITPVKARSSKDTRDMHITVDGNGLDPYIQRVVVNTMAEIERNRG